MELTIFARFRARQGDESELACVLREQVAQVRAEPGCLEIAAFGATRDSRLYFIHSRWSCEAAFEIHAELTNTNAILARVQALIDHPLDVTRTRAIG